MALSTLPVLHELLGHVYSDAEWEALCDRCGLCCYESRWSDEGWEHTSIPCRYLGPEAECRIYNDRLDAETDCIRVTASVVMSGMLPKDCAYVQELDRISEIEYEPVERAAARRHGRRGKPSRRRAQR